VLLLEVLFDTLRDPSRSRVIRLVVLGGECEVTRGVTDSLALQPEVEDVVFDCRQTNDQG